MEAHKSERKEAWKLAEKGKSAGNSCPLLSEGITTGGPKRTVAERHKWLGRL